MNKSEAVVDSELLCKPDRRSVIDCYTNEQDAWSEMSIFQGGFINFGYWRNIALSHAPISLRERVKSALDLYCHIAKYLNIGVEDDVLEVGSGRGVGALNINRLFAPRSIKGIDITPSQVDIANKLVLDMSMKEGGPSFHLADALKMPFSSNSFSKIYSVEVAQHIDQLDMFFTELRRVLKPGGRLVLTTFYPTTPGSVSKVASLFPFVGPALGSLSSICEVERALNVCGFSGVDVHSIGEFVFSGYVKWSRQVVAENEWTYNFLTAYDQGLLDYYVLVAS